MSTKYENLNVATRSDFNFLIDLLGLNADEFYHYIGMDASRVTLIAKGQRDWSAGCLRLAYSMFEKVADDVTILKPMFRAMIEQDYYGFVDKVRNCNSPLVFKRIKGCASKTTIASLAKNPTVFNKGVVRHRRYFESLKESCDKYEKIMSDIKFYIEQQEETYEK